MLESTRLKAKAAMISTNRELHEEKKFKKRRPKRSKTEKKEKGQEDTKERLPKRSRSTKRAATDAQMSFDESPKITGRRMKRGQRKEL